MDKYIKNEQNNNITEEGSGDLIQEVSTVESITQDLDEIKEIDCNPLASTNPVDSEPSDFFPIEDIQYGKQKFVSVRKYILKK